MAIENKEGESTCLLDKPYADRQFVLVTADDVASAATQALQQQVKKPGEIDWSPFTNIVLSLVPVVGPLAIAASELVRLWGRVRDNGVNAILVGKSEAAKITFPPGHPRAGVLYIGHPAIPDTYYTTAEFHRAIFEHKVAEAVSLLMHLGATGIRVHHVAGWSKEFSSTLTLPLGAVGEEVGLEAGLSADSGAHLLYQATLAGTETPALPQDLIWFPHEPSWKSIADGRLRFGLEQFSLTVAYKDDFGVNAGLRASVQRSGLELGGRFEDHRSTVWRIEGEFLSAKPRTVALPSDARGAST